MESLASLVVAYLFEKANTLLKRTTYHGIYRDESLVVLKGKKSIKEIKHWLVEFQKISDKELGNQHLQFTAEIWTNDKNLNPYAKNDKVQVVTNYTLHLLDMKMSCPPEGDLQFGVFKKK